MELRNILEYHPLLWDSFPCKGRVELVEDGEALFRGAAGGEGAEAGFGVELGDADGGQVLDEFVDADGAVFRQPAEPEMFVVGQADGELAHGDECLSECLHRQPRNAAEFVGVVCHNTVAVCEGRGRDPHVVRADELAFCCEVAVDFAVAP